MMRILFLSRWFPYPPSNGSKLRIYHLLRGLSQRHQVALISFFDPGREAPDISALQPFCSPVRAVPYKPYDPRSWSARLGLLSPAPRFVRDTYSPMMERCIEEALSAEDFDAVIASQIDTAVYVRCFQGLPALFEEAEVGLLYETFTNADSSLKRLRYGLMWAKHRRYLSRLLRKFRACTVVSERERKLLAGAAPGYEAVEVIPNSVDLADYERVPKAARANTLIFTGSFRYYPNYEAMDWFLSQVYPRIQSQAPDVRLVITGDHGNMPLPPSKNVELTGFVEDVRPHLASAAISLVPIRMGGGTRLKILEAMALQTPVVATTKGAEGLRVVDGVNILLADTPEAYAEAVLRLLKDPGLRERLADSAFRFVRETYDWKVTLPHFMDLVEGLASNGTNTFTDTNHL